MTTTGADDGLLERIKWAWETARGIEPARGSTDRSQVQAVRAAIEQMSRAKDAELAGMSAEDRDDAEAAIASVYARAAAVAIAAADEDTGYKWILEAEQLSKDEDQRAELAVARRTPERYRALVHGRNLMANGGERAALSIWKTLAKDGDKDAISRAAKLAIRAPRPLGNSTPTLARWNGVGLGFYGSRDRWSDGSYATTHCFSVVWIPLIPVGAYRVRPSEGGYIVMAREGLSSFARIARLAVVAAVVLGIAGYGVSSYLRDPDRLARNRFDDALAAADGKDAEAALRGLDAELTGPDFQRVGGDRREAAGAAVVRRTAGLVPKPFTATALDQAIRVVRRFQALPEPARGGKARDAILAALDAWIGAVSADPETQLALLREASAIAIAGGDGTRAATIEATITTTRLAVAAAMADSPLDALSVLVDDPAQPATTDAATQLLGRLVDAPSLLDDASADVDAWLAAVPQSEPLRAQVTEARDRGAGARAEAEADGVTPAQLAAMQKARPWDQRVGLMLAREDASAGKLEAAEARLRAFGAPGLLIRDARFLLAQLAAAGDHLEEADALMTGLLATRLRRFAAAGAALQAATKQVQDRVEAQLDAGNVPPGLRAKLESQTMSDSEQRDALSEWLSSEMESDPTVTDRRAAYVALSDVVPVSLAAGSVKLRRAQALSGPARDAMLQEAERTFLAIRNEAEGQPEFHLGLGEIYARLGKVEESEQEFGQLIATGDPQLGLQVAHVYRDIGSVERSKQVATDVYAKASSPLRESAAVLLGLLSTGDDDAAEAWYRKADPSNPFVRVSLLEIEGGRLYRQGKYGECAAKFAQVAKANLAVASTANLSGFNNAALAYQRQFNCTGDLESLRDAEAALEKAYRIQPDDPIVVGNLAVMLDENAKVRVLAKRVDVKAIKLTVSDADDLIAVLIANGEREAIGAELAADAGARRSTGLLAQYEVLAPNNTTAYQREIEQALRRRDEAAVATVLARMKQAKALDTSAMAEARERFISGALDAQYLEGAAATIAHETQMLARPKLDAKSRAAALYIAGSTRIRFGQLKAEPATIVTGRAEMVQAMKLWPALDANGELVFGLIDEAGVTADPKTWSALRRTHSPVEALAELTESSAGLGATIRASAQWGQVSAFAHADTSHPGVDDVRLARLLGDADLITRAAAAFDDKLVRMRLELSQLSDPTDPTAAAALAVLDAR